jgi:hypothetical protein
MLRHCRSALPEHCLTGKRSRPSSLKGDSSRSPDAASINHASNSSRVGGGGGPFFHDCHNDGM